MTNPPPNAVAVPLPNVVAPNAISTVHSQAVAVPVNGHGIWFMCDVSGLPSGTVVRLGLEESTDGQTFVETRFLTGPLDSAGGNMHIGVDFATPNENANFTARANAKVTKPSTLVWTAYTY